MFVDYPRFPGDTVGMFRVSPAKDSTETVMVGSVSLFGDNPPPVYVPGISPPSNIPHYPPYQLVHFVLRLRFAQGLCTAEVSNLHVRNATVAGEIERMLGLYQDGRKSTGTLPPRPRSLPVETVFAAWLPTKPTPAQAATSPGPTEKQARELNEVGPRVLGVLRRAMLR
jgi:hypothetical protein